MLWDAEKFSHMDVISGVIVGHDGNVLLGQKTLDGRKRKT
jgi:hypothetical protein